MRYLFADCLLDTQCYLLRRAGQSIRLRPKVFQALTYLLTNRDRVIAKQELCEQVWSAQAVSDATIENCLKAIRHAIGDNGQAQRLIETRYGQGYRFVATVTMSSDGAAPKASETVALLPAYADVSLHDPPVALDAVCQPPYTVPRVMRFSPGSPADRPPPPSQGEGSLCANRMWSEVTRACHALSCNLSWLHLAHARIMLGTHCGV